MGRRLAGGIALTLVVGILVAVWLGERRFTRGSVALERRLASPARTAVCDLRAETAGLPAPVARYFRRVLRDGAPLPVRVRVRQTGSFRMGEAEDSWRPFTATQVFAIGPPGFVWDARVRLFPGLGVRVRDSYVAGSGGMRAALAGLLPVMDAAATPELASGALQRYLAEAMWFPTALLPSQGVRWTPIDQRRALATLADGSTEVSLEFRIAADGELESVYAPARFRESGGAYVATPWEGRVLRTEEREGLRIPVEVEVLWQIDGRPFPYFRGGIDEISYVVDGAGR
jgi:hypothetical protein